MVNDAVIEVLSKSLQDANPGVRKSAAIALLKIGTANALEHLEVIKEDENQEIRDLVTRALKKIKTNTQKQIPPWNESYANLDSSSSEQKEFYNYWLSQIENSNYIDLDDNLSYIFIYLYNVIYDFIENQDIKILIQKFDKIMEFYGFYPSVRSYLLSWKSDAHLFLEEYENYLSIKKKIGFKTHDIITHGFIDEDSLITGEVLINIKSNGLTDYGMKNKDEIIPFLDALLYDFKEINGKNIVKHILGFSLKNKEDLKKLKKFFEYEEKFHEITQYIDSISYSGIDKKNISKENLLKMKKTMEEGLLSTFEQSLSLYSSEEFVDVTQLNNHKLNLWNSILEDTEFEKLKEKYDSNLRQRNFDFHQMVTVHMAKMFENYNFEEIDTLSTILSDTSHYKIYYDLYKSEQKNAEKKVVLYNIFGGVPDILTVQSRMLNIPYVLFVALENEIKRFIREAENKLREERGIPLVGEGWVNETELYYKIKEAFPQETIVQHGRPSWLGQQHLDIFFSEKNIGIEYQGIQHEKPVDFFGGVEGFENAQERDKRKRLLCKKNNCKLIYVYPNYNFKDVEKEIKKSF